MRLDKKLMTAVATIAAVFSLGSTMLSQMDTVKLNQLK